MTAEQQARDLLERMGIRHAQGFSAGTVVELANLIRDHEQALEALRLVKRKYSHIPSKTLARSEIYQSVCQVLDK